MLLWNRDWLISQVALEDAVLTAIRDRKYSAENDYATAAKSRERMNGLLRELGEE